MSFSIIVEELEKEHYTRIRLGYRPEAPPPDLANVKSRISNKLDKKHAKKKSVSKAGSCIAFFPKRNPILLKMVASKEKQQRVSRLRDKNHKSFGRQHPQKS